MNSKIISQIERYVEKETKDISPVHGFCHLKRTAVGARWFSELFGGTREDQDIAYVAGLIHDLKRPSSEKIDHTQISLDEAKKVLEKFNIIDKTARNILQLIKEHRIFHDVPLIQQSVFLSDKLLEQSGAYVVFRRSFYIGECEDFREIPFEEAVISYWTKRMKKFSPGNYVDQVRDLAIHQFENQELFLNAFIEKQVWARRLALDFYQYGEMQKTDLDTLMVSYKTEYNEIKQLQQEAGAYIRGEKLSEYTSMIHRV